MVLKTEPSGRIIFRQGEEGDAMYVVLSGACTVRLKRDGPPKVSPKDRSVHIGIIIIVIVKQSLSNSAACYRSSRSTNESNNTEFILSSSDLGRRQPSTSIPAAKKPRR